MNKQEIDDKVCDLLIKYGPDGHVDGHERITQFICDLLDDEREELVEALSILLKEYRQFLWDEFSNKDDEYSRRAKKALARAKKQ
jgi:hypothetical protein